MHTGILHESTERWAAEAYRFRTGSLCLDFAHTGGEDELLVAPEDLRRWLAICALRLDDARVTPAELELATTLRTAIWWTARRAIAREAPADDDAAAINGVAELAPLVPRLAPRAGWRTPAPGSAALSTIARDAIALLGGPLALRIRECANPGCDLLFVDDSRSGRRRWCSMSRCGNRAKVARHRRRAAAQLDM